MEWWPTPIPARNRKVKSMGFVVKKSVEKKPLWKMIRARPPIFEENFVRLEDIIIVSK